MQESVYKYLEHLRVEKNFSINTYEAYRRNMVDFLAFLNEKKITSIDKIDKYTIRDYLSFMHESKKAKTTVAQHLATIRSFFRYLSREKIVIDNPASDISSPRLEKRLPKFLTIKEIGKLLNTTNLNTPQGQRDRAILELLYASGIRVSELMNIDLEQVFLDTKELRIKGKGGKERMVLMGTPSIIALNRYIAEGRARLLGNRENHALFLSYGGKRYPVRQVQKMLDRKTEQSGIDKKVSPHVLRHTFATHLLDGGADLRVVQELLGHSNLSSTQVYTHVTKAQAKKVYLSAHPLAKKGKEE